MHTTFDRSESSQVGYSEAGQVSPTVSADFAHCHRCSSLPSQVESNAFD